VRLEIAKVAKLKTSRSLRLCFFLLWATFTARALDPSRYLSQYAHSSWTIQDGTFSGSPNAITQTRDGYLWIGTEAGLVRFDGVRFVPWVEPEGKHLLTANVYSLLGAQDGSLWIGTGNGVARWTNGDLINFPGTIGRINSIREDDRGKVWMVRTRLTGQIGPLCGIEGREIHCYGADEGLKCSYGSELAIDTQENLWIGSSDALCRWKPGSSSIYLKEELKKTEGLAGVSALATGDDGVVWAGIPRAGKTFGLRQLLDGVWTSYIVPGMDGASLAVNTLFLDRNHALWVGTVNQGIYRVYNGKADHFSSSDGLSSNSIKQFYQDREGNVWVATSKGIDCFRDVRVATFSIREGLTADGVSSVLAAKDGALWIGNQGALDVLRQGTISKMTARDGLPGQDVTSLLEDSTGKLWVGVDQELAVYDHKRFRLIKRPDGTPVGAVVAMSEDTDHNIWVSTIGTGDHLIRIRDFNPVEDIPMPSASSAVALARDPRSGIWMGLAVVGGLGRYRDGRSESIPLTQGAAPSAVRNLLVDPDGTVWGATSRGLVRWKEGKVEILNSHNGLPCDPIFALVRDNLGSLWLSTKCGFVAIADSELAKWQKQPDLVVTVRTYDIYDGAQPAHSSFQPSVSKSPDGRLWFANDSFLQMIDPSHLQLNTLPPPVHIEQVVADRKNYATSNKVSLPALTRDLEIDYTALSFVVPHKVRFRYKLEGRDTNWQDPMTRRQAFYSDLRPGNYRFHVIACNNDGVWNENGATLNLSIAPAWFQTMWFRIFCLASLLAIAWILYRVRVQQVAKAIGARFDERLSERTRMARELHDTFLQTIQGSKFVVDDGLEEPLDPERMHRALGQVSGWLEQAIAEGRAALNSLRSSTTLKNELGPALRRAAEGGVVPDGMTISLSVIGDAQELHPIVRDELYRIGNEAIQNSKVHSHGSFLGIDLTYAQDLTLHVRDNGVGINPDYAMSGRDGHHGLQGMRERAARIQGRLTIISSSESGTDISVIVPGSVSFLHPDNGTLANLRKLYHRIIGHHETL
jgi:ligand-binding sensor domain-containing protein/signal transduction histidine kinase